MKIIDMLRQEKPSLSFEVFPPKAADKYDSVEAAAAEIAKLKPSFMSITYGAGGGTSQYTVDIASTIQNTYHVNALAHLTCVSSTREHVRGVLDRIRENGLENVLAIRERGVTVPVVAGIMPVTNAKQITRICKLSGTYLPARFKAIVDRFGDNPAAMQQAGIAYATEQIIDLIANGINGIHVYSMNKPEVARAIKESLSEIL